MVMRYSYLRLVAFLGAAGACAFVAVPSLAYWNDNFLDLYPEPRVLGETATASQTEPVNRVEENASTDTQVVVTPPVSKVQITNLAVRDITSSDAVISYLTDVAVGTDLGYAPASTGEWVWGGGNILVTAHEISFENAFQPNTTYYYRARVRDGSGNLITQTAVQKFTTLSKITPQPLPAVPTDIVRRDASVSSGMESLKRAEKIIENNAVLKPKSTQSATRIDSIKNFIAFGTVGTEKLGAGERAGVVSSFTEAFGRTPETASDWDDAVRIASGRFPGQKNAAREKLAERKFREIYKRPPNRTESKHDDAAVVVMAYGLRPAERNLASETAAIGTFRAVYGKAPTAASDWDTVRAIAYSGASRELKKTNAVPDSDHDGLSDADEATYGTDASNPDTDGDGYSDGTEVLNSYNPKGPGKLAEVVKDDKEEGEGSETVGQLVVTLAPAPVNPISGLHAAGTTDKVVAAFRFSASGEAFSVKKLTLVPYVMGAVSDASNDRIAKLSVRYPSITGRVTVSPKISLRGTLAVVDLSADPMRVPTNGSVNLEVLVDWAPFTLLDGTEREQIAFGIDADNGLGNNVAVGVQSGGTDNTWQESDVTANSQQVLRTVLSVTAGTGTPNQTSRARQSDQKVWSGFLWSSSPTTVPMLRGSIKAPDATLTGWDTVGFVAQAISPIGVSGNKSVEFTQDNASAVNDHGYVDFGENVDLAHYSRLSFWIRVTSALPTKPPGDFSVSWSTEADTVDDGQLRLGMFGTYSLPELQTNYWQYVDIAVPNLDPKTRYVTFNIAAHPEPGAKIWIDELRLYNDSLTLLVVGNLNQESAVGLPFYLKSLNSTVLAFGAAEDISSAQTKARLIPGSGVDVSAVTLYGSVNASIDPANLDVTTNTLDLVANMPGQDDILGVYVRTSMVGGGGDVLWYDQSDGLGGDNAPAYDVVNPTSTTIGFQNFYLP